MTLLNESECSSASPLSKSVTRSMALTVTVSRWPASQSLPIEDERWYDAPASAHSKK